MSFGFKQLLPICYKRFLSHQLIFEWLSTEENQTSGYDWLTESSFTLKNDFYMTYLSFESLMKMDKRSFVDAYLRKKDMEKFTHLNLRWHGLKNLLSRTK